MTRKHFEVIARLLAETRLSLDDSRSVEVIDNFAGDLASVFQGLNPRFDSARFIDATKREV